MTKRKSKISIPFRISWRFTLLIGVVIGISIQQIPKVRALTSEIIYPAEHHFPHESNPNHPISTFLVSRTGYTISYDAQHKNPKWVFEHITSASLKGESDRSHSVFREDENIPQHLRSTLLDYRGSGYDRGHQAAAANHKSSVQAMEDTFYLSNVCPQNPQCNRGHWAALEKYVRDLTRDYENVYVFSGPLYLPNHEENGRRYVKYEVLGENNVSVPTHFYKVITLEDWHGKKEIKAFIVPNAEISQNTNLDTFSVTVSKVEKAAGIIFSKGN